MSKVLIGLLVFLVLGGVLTAIVPMEARWKNLIYIVSAVITVVIVLVFLLRVFGVWTTPLPF